MSDLHMILLEILFVVIVVPQVICAVVFTIWGSIFIIVWLYKKIKKLIHNPSP